MLTDLRSAAAASLLLCAVSAFYRYLRHLILFLFDDQGKGADAFRIPVILLVIHHECIGKRVFSDYLEAAITSTTAFR